MPLKKIQLSSQQNIHKKILIKNEAHISPDIPELKGNSSKRMCTQILRIFQSLGLRLDSRLSRSTRLSSRFHHGKLQKGISIHPISSKERKLNQSLQACIPQHLHPVQKWILENKVYNRNTLRHSKHSANNYTTHFQAIGTIEQSDRVKSQLKRIKV